MDKLLKSLYPVKYDGMVYIWSKRGMLMDIDVRMRGWGWIQYLAGKVGLPTDAEVTQDTIGKFIEEAINEKLQRDFNLKQ